MSHVLIIGAGIVGLSSAYYLQKQGHQVTVLDKGEVTDSCSFGNAGMIVPSHFVPLASPGMVQQGIRWMFNSKSPFYVRPSADLSLINWGLKFLKSANSGHVARSAVPLRDLSLLSKQLFERLAAEPGFEFELKNNGILAFYKTEKVAEEEAHLAGKAKELGLDMGVLNAAECQLLQPELQLDVLGAVHYRCDGHLYPQKLMGALVHYLEHNGVNIVRGSEVSRIEQNGKEITKVFTGERAWKADHYVLASGSWSPAVAKMMDIRVPLMPGKGYSFMEPNSEHKIIHPALLIEARVAVTPMNGQVRFGGTMELAALNDKINMNRVEGIVNSIPQYYPELQVDVPEKDKIWYGFRPCSPDGLPYLGYSKKLKNLIVAGGHGMMGISLGAATGKIVAELADRTSLSADIKLYDPERYN